MSCGASCGERIASRNPHPTTGRKLRRLAGGDTQAANAVQHTLERAKPNLGLKGLRQGVKGRQGGGEWYWHLPELKVATAVNHEIGGLDLGEEMVWTG